MRVRRITFSPHSFIAVCLLNAFACTAFAANRYVEPALCGTCHSNISAKYAQTGMARSFGTIGPDTKPAPGSFRHEPSRESFEIAQTSLRRWQIGFNGKPTNVVTRPMDYWIGSGIHARSYLSKDTSGEIVELPVTWYAERGGGWGMSPGYESSTHAGFSRRTSERCLFCHTANPVDSIAPSNSIDCQRCHGPGGNHIEAVGLKRDAAAVRSSIVNPSRLTPDRKLEVCLQCHLETTTLSLPSSLLRYGRAVYSYRPGEPLGEYQIAFDHAPGTGHDDKLEFASSAYRLFQSACYRANPNALTCTTCHDPHQQATGKDAADRYARVCQDCHSPRLTRLVEARRHTASTDCVACHMAKSRPSDAIHVTIVDHYIRRVPPTTGNGTPVEQNSSNTPPYRGKVVAYYPRQTSGDDQLYAAVAQVKNQANLPEGSQDLERAILKIRPSRAEFYVDSGDAYRHLGETGKAVASYAEALRINPEEWLAFHGMGLALASQGDLTGAAKALQKAQGLAPGETALAATLAGFWVQLNRLPDALDTLRRGIASNPESADLHNSLGTTLLRSGDSKEAEAEIREAVRLRPEMAGMHLNLANLLARRGGFREAKYEFEEAFRIDPALSSNAHNNLGTVYSELGQINEAIRQFQLAIGMEPRYATAHYNLALALARQGHADTAEDQLEEAIRYSPEYFDAHLKLAELLIQRAHPELAAPHLHKAAQSPDARVRVAAAKLLAAAQ